ncbi:hypothetical protein ABIB62_004470 [Mucilaginibacter sp. UYP25]|uniref:hypothetical protein n=1 Tax=unclassified Mucilaginibacter TaxID=2617802 RepID=UPI0033983A31
MKVAYFFISPQAGLLRLVEIILPELENDQHPIEVVAMCFFDENEIALDLGNDIGKRLNVLAKNQGILLLKSVKTIMNHLQIASVHKTVTRRNPSECVVVTLQDGNETGCFPDFYTAAYKNLPDRIISL